LIGGVSVDSHHSQREAKAALVIEVHSTYFKERAAYHDLT
jgi:hypothetical protein